MQEILKMYLQIGQLIKFENGEIHTVQVFDTTGNSMPLDVDVYIEREIKPDIKRIFLMKEDFQKNS